MRPASASDAGNGARDERLFSTLLTVRVCHQRHEARGTARGLLERHAVANWENLWNGRPISLIVLAEPLEVLDGATVALIELISPVHQRVYKMGLEHLGFVVGDAFDPFVQAHKPVLSGQQFQGANAHPTPCTSCSKTSRT